MEVIHEINVMVQNFKSSYSECLVLYNVENDSHASHITDFSVFFAQSFLYAVSPMLGGLKNSGCSPQFIFYFFFGETILILSCCLL